MTKHAITTHRRIKRYFICSVYLLLLGSSLPAIANTIALPEPPNKGLQLEEKDLAARKQLADMIKNIAEHPDLKDKITVTGEERTVFCNVCHGKDGNSVRPGIPNLASQNPVYLLDQFQRFSDGRRYDRAMSSLATSFSEEEKVMLAIYYSSMQVTPSEVKDSEQWLRGKKVYQDGCATCHGENGRGEKGYARLASQKPDYVVKMLKEFRTTTGRRDNPWMTVVTNNLTEQEMADVAAYVSTLE